MKAKASKNKLLLHIALTVLLAALLFTGIYAWIYGDTAPTITGSMKIGDTSGLVFVINTGEAEEKKELVNLNEHLGLSTANMILNEVSSADGVTFLKRDTSLFFLESGHYETDEDGVTALKNDEILTFSPAISNHVESVDEGGMKYSGDYLHTDLYLQLEYADEGAKYYIYFLDGSLGTLTGYKTGFSAKPDSRITENGLRALRTSIAVKGAQEYGPVLNNENHRMIFGNVGETVDAGLTRAVVKTQNLPLRMVGVDDPFSVEVAGEYCIDYLPGYTGMKMYGELTPGMNVQSFESCAIDAAAGLEGARPSDNYLFVLDRNCKSVQLSISVWLEGGSVFCENENININDDVQLDLYFVAYKVYEN